MSTSRSIAASLLAFLLCAGLLAAFLTGIGSRIYHDWNLVFQTQLASFSFWGFLTLSLCCVAAITALFRYEQRLVPLRLGIGLLTLRLSLILIIFLTLLKPIWTWSYDQTERRRLLLALDVSQSMETVDKQATQSEQIRWAEAIGMLSTGDDQSSTKKWIADIQAGREPVWVSAQEEPDAQRRESLAQIRKQAVEAQLAELKGLSRYEILRRTLEQSLVPTLAPLQKQLTSQFAAIADSAELMKDGDLQKFATVNDFPIKRNHTNLVEVATASALGSNTSPLAGVVVFSDGNDTNSKKSAEVINRLSGLGVPVHTVLIGSEHRPKDISVLHVDHPESVFLNDHPLIKGVLQTSGYEGTPLRVFLDDLDALDEAPLEQTLTPIGPIAEVSFTLPDLTAGRHRFRIRTEIAPGESREDNNIQEFSLNVVDDRAQILLIEGESRWEFRFLDAALTRDKQVTIDHVLFEQPFMRVLSQPFFPTKIDESESTSSPVTPLAKYDLVLLGDVSPQNLGSHEWTMIDRYVREEGGTLVLTAGKRFFPAAYRGTLIDGLLPIENFREIRANDAVQTGSPTTRGFRLAITPEGNQLPIFQLDADPSTSKKIWASLPGHLWGIVGEARAGASVWASATGANVQSNLASERQNALIVQQYVGNGQVVWIGIDSTWRWRYLVGDLYHHRFWGQLMRWAVSFKATAGNDLVRLGLRESAISAGQTAHLQARWNQRIISKTPHFQTEAVIERTGDGPAFSQTVSLQQRPGNPLIFEGQFANLPAGEFLIKLKSNAELEGNTLPEIPLIVNAELTAELQNVSTNRALLEQIASSTGGKFLQLNELDQLPELLTKTQEVQRVREEIPLFNHWLILVLFSAIAMTEWVLRKLNGLP
ncbi:hypothetical protein SH668x_002705 [Planctomicrobium sp. SH668]|uniref:hypothetical protein n=1 Tax=Planctomicrobium sp. SH668 TaxID=3448126 RepID=UPI003F5ADEAF